MKTVLRFFLHLLCVVGEATFWLLVIMTGAIMALSHMLPQVTTEQTSEGFLFALLVVSTVSFARGRLNHHWFTFTELKPALVRVK